MNVEAPISLVVGCGKGGLEWANRQKRGELIIGLDYQDFRSSSPNFRIGDVLNLPFEDRSINRIYADFILNAVAVKNILFKDIINNPSVLGDKPFPKIVNDWFIYSLNGSAERVRENLENVRWLLRTQAMSEMIRVLDKNGEIFIIDRPKIVNWVGIQAINDLGLDPKKVGVEKLEINSDDYARSASLREITKDGDVLGKIRFKKLY